MRAFRLAGAARRLAREDFLGTRSGDVVRVIHPNKVSFAHRLERRLSVDRSRFAGGHRLRR
jgi:hypothetical protein